MTGSRSCVRVSSHKLKSPRRGDIREDRSSQRVSRRTAVTFAVRDNARERYPPKLEQLITSFNAVPDPMLRYKQLLFLAKKLPPLHESELVQENKVPGCTSQVWISVKIASGSVVISADSDSQLTKGLAALIVEGLSGASVQSVLDVPLDFIESFGLKQSLTPSRTNGFRNMLQLVKDKVKAIAQQE